MTGYDEFYNTITQVHGQAGKNWLDSLPNLVKACAKKWNLTNLEPVEDLTYNYVLTGLQGLLPIILKLRYVGYDRVLLQREIDGLTVMQQHGGVQLLAYDSTLGALLLERIVPGTALTDFVPVDDNQATIRAAQLLQQLHQISNITTLNVSQLEDVIPTFEKNFSELQPFIHKARSLRDLVLVKNPYAQSVLLHGDFHHGNILLGESDRYYAIDPEIMLGDPGYDMAIFIRNPLKQIMSMPHVKELLLTRIDTFSKLFNYDRQRLQYWVYLQAFTSAYWSLEDGSGIAHHKAFLTLLETL